jgi:hypothetical protein
MSELPDTYSGDEQGFDRGGFLGRALLVIGGAALSRIPIAGAARATEPQAFLELSRVATGVQNLPGPLAPKYFVALDAAPELKLKPSRFLQLAGYTDGQDHRTFARWSDRPRSKRTAARSAARRSSLRGGAGLCP